MKKLLVILALFSTTYIFANGGDQKGPKAKNKKIWNKEEVAPAPNTFAPKEVKGPSAKNQKQWDKTDELVVIPVKVDTKRESVQGPKYKNKKHKGTATSNVSVHEELVASDNK